MKGQGHSAVVTGAASALGVQRDGNPAPLEEKAPFSGRASRSLHPGKHDYEPEVADHRFLLVDVLDAPGLDLLARTPQSDTPRWQTPVQAFERWVWPELELRLAMVAQQTASGGES